MDILLYVVMGDKGYSMYWKTLKKIRILESLYLFYVCINISSN